MKNLSEIPNSVLTGFKPFLEMESPYYELSMHEEFYLFFKGKDSNIDCFFKVISYDRANSGEFIVTFSQKPHSSENIEEKKMSSKLSSLGQYFKVWENLLKDRKELHEIFNHKKRILDLESEFFKESEFYNDKYEEEYFSTLELQSLSKTCVLMIDFIEKDKNIKNKEELIVEIKSLETNSALESKRKLSKRFSKIKALIIKNGPTILKEIYTIAKDLGVGFVQQKYLQ